LYSGQAAAWAFLLKTAANFGDTQANNLKKNRKKYGISYNTIA
jgi:hypothetical protein